MVENKLVQTPFITNCKLLKDMGLQNDANLEIMRVILFKMLLEISCTCNGMHKI
jgi:hypothetical protein